MPIPVAPPLDSSVLYTGHAYVQIGDLTFVPGTLINGVWWDLEPIDGWSAPPDRTERTEQRNADHGAWLKQGYYAPRDLELKGTLTGQSWSTLNQAWATLKAAVPSFDPVTLVVGETGDFALQADIIQGDGPPLINKNAAEWEFSFSLIAPDPRRYSLDTTSASTGLPVTSGGLSLPITLPITIGATTTSGLLTLTNSGDMPTRPTLTITGPCPPCTITHSSNRRLTVPDAVPAGRSLVLDTDARSAVLDGTASRVVTGTWFELDPGVNSIQFASATYDASALLTVSFRSAWR